ncbi:U3 snoRNP protein Utp20 [Ephemerocybe angulata]|uniref:U3 snoRNP protein Utp20 n=1 Tax=Ephemerocybe angulata TaxID=980116 RepID=A0A8H6IAW6_9AGAR|nr:U3 snoRNP protein Utp20 [Tulosesus angulatus]
MEEGNEFNDYLELDFPEPTKRFRHQSYNQQLKGVHLPSTFQQTQYDQDIGENGSHFHEALDHWRQLNLSPGFIQFVNQADSMSASMPLLLHNWREIIEIWITAMESSDDEGLRALLDLLQKMAHDLRTTLAPVYDDIIRRLLKHLTRSISPEALTYLLETFNTLFRFLLVPSIHPELLDSTWSSIKSTLPKCLPEIQRAMAEVWGSVLRKLKTTARERAVTLLAESAEGVDDASAWVLVYACKSVSQTLHTATASIVSPLLAYHLKTDNPEPTFNLIRRTLTALIHHVKNAEQFSSLGNLVVQQVKASIKVGEEEQTRRAVLVATIPCSVRQGSRLTDTQKMSLFTDLEALEIKPSTHEALLPFAVSLYTSTEMAAWISQGMKFLQRAWSLASGDDFHWTFVIQLNGALAELGWGGWKLVALPLLLKNTVKEGVAMKEGTFSFLARVRRGKKLSVEQTDLVWRTRVEKAARERLGEVEKLGGAVGPDVAAEVNDILTLSPFFSPTITPVIISLIDAFLISSPPAPAPTNPAASWILGTALDALSNRSKDEWAQKVDARKWASLVLERWGQSSELLEAMVQLAQELPPSKSSAERLRFSTAYATLKPCLLSHSRALRLAALRFLTSPHLIDNSDNSDGDMDSEDSAVGSSAREVLKRCLQGEEASLDVAGVRERVLRIGRVGQVVGDALGAEACVRWLVAQLKVNLRPLWSPATAAISGLAGRWGDVVWAEVFGELKSITGEASGKEVGDEGNVEHGQGGSEEVEEDEVNEKERSWRDPSAHKFRVAVSHWLDGEYHRRMFVKSRQASERFDRVSYEFQLLATMGECSSLAEKHNRELVPYFLSLADPESTHVSSPTSSALTTNRTALSKQKLVSWLTLFSKFQNPKAMYATQSLKALYTASLSHPFRPLQRVALDCLFTYKSPHLSSMQDTFKTLLDDTRWRDELTNLDLSALGTGQTEGRSEVVDLLLRLLFGLMLEKKGRGKNGGGADRRAAVLGTIGGCTEEELRLLVDLMLMPLGIDSSAHAMGGEEERFEIAEVGSEVGGRQVMGYLTLLGDVTRLLGSRLMKYWPALIGTTVDILHFAQRKIEEEAAAKSEDVDMEGEGQEEVEDEDVEGEGDADEKHFSGKTLRSIRQTGLKRLADFFKIPVLYAFEPYLAASFKSVISPRLKAFASENIQSPSAILDLLHVWSNNHDHAFYLVRYDSRVLPALWDCLIAQNVKPVVVERIFDVIERLVGYAEIDEKAKEEILQPHVELLLTNLATLVERTKGGQSKSGGSLSLSLTTPLGQRHLAILSSLSPFATSPSQATTLFSLFLPLLKKPNKQVPEKVKANILIILKDIMGLVPDLSSPTSPLWTKLFGNLSTLFSTLRGRAARSRLVDAFSKMEDVVDASEASLKEWLHFVSSHLTLLNAYSVKRMDEPDFDKRLAAYSSFNDETYVSEVLARAPVAWSPILYQAFHDIQDVEELALRISAGLTLRRFVEKVAEVVGAGEKKDQVVGYEGTYGSIFLTHFLPSLRSALSTPLSAQGPNATSSFAVKGDLLSLLSFTVSNTPQTLSPTIAALHPLLEEGDEEANFFNNVLHIQIHRRTRALRRLGERCEKGEFTSATDDGSNAVVREWLLPIVTWFIGNGSSFMKTQTNQHKEDQSNHLTTNEAIVTLGRLSAYLGWSPYYGLVQRYLRLANGNDEWEKIYVRTIVSILENFRFEVAEEVEEVAMEVDGAEEAEVGAEEEVGEGQQEDEEQVVAKVETKAPRRKANILVSVKSKLLPSLLAYLSPPAQKFKEDETPVTVRLPVALAIARLTLRLPGSTADERARKQTEMRRLATELSHMMKSRSQEVRDAVRDVLGRIALTVLGLDGGKVTDLGVDDFDADSYLKVLVDELETALIRGPQLHILATTVNSIIAKVVAGVEGRALPKTAEEETAVDEDVNTGDKKPAPTTAKRPLLLDEIVPSLTSISSTILFGDVSSNPEANNGGSVPTNHVSATFREPRQSLNASYSLYAFSAQYSSPSVLPDLLRDVKGVMGVTNNVKTMAIVDEVLRRVGGGLERNRGIEKGASEVSDSDWLVNVTWGLVSGNVAFLKEREDWNNPKGKKKKGKPAKPKNDHIVQRSRNVNVESDQYAHNSYRFIVLGLDLLHTSLRRGRFSDANATVYKQLDALLPVLGNALYSTSTPVLLHGLKCLSLLVTRFPIAKLPGMRRALPVFVNQVLTIIKSSGGGGGNMGGTDGELIKGALRSLGTMVRDGPKSTTTGDGVVLPGVDLKEKDLSFLLELVTPDLEDPDKQGVAFALLRAIVSRRFVVPEMYDIMEDQVAPLLVQSQANTVREQARALLLQFMLDYPQGKGRLQKTLAFLLRNASSYVHESGRTSILELLGAVLTKFQSGLIAEYGEMIFVSLVMVLANDDSSKCREAAALLISTLYSRFSEDDRKNIVRTWLKKWVRAGVNADGAGEGAVGKRKLAWIALQVWGIIIEAAAKEEGGNVPWIGEVVEDVSQGLQQSEVLMAKRLTEDEDDSMDVDGAGSSKDEAEWQLPYYALSTLGKTLSVCPSLAKATDGKKNVNAGVPWSLVTSHLLFPHAWVRTAACRALGQLFNAYPLGADVKSAVQTIQGSPAFDSESAVSVGSLRDVAAKLCDQLKSEHLDGTLGLQIVKNLLWIGRVWLVEADDEDAPAALDEEESEAEDDGEAVVQKQGTLGNLPWLFSKLSYQIRGSLIRRKGRHGRTPNWSQQPLAAVRWFAAMATYMTPARLEKFLTHILSPVYRIIEEDTIQDQQLDELRTTATELRELIQQKVGGTVFSTTYNVIRQKVLEVRRERKTKRLVIGTLDPAQAAKRKEKKTLLKKESRKRKDRSFADSRGGTKRRKEF